MDSPPPKVSFRDSRASPRNQLTSATAAGAAPPVLALRSSTTFLIGLPSRVICRCAFVIIPMVSVLGFPASSAA